MTYAQTGLLPSSGICAKDHPIYKTNIFRVVHIYSNTIKAHFIFNLYTNLQTPF